MGNVNNKNLENITTIGKPEVISETLKQGLLY